MWLYPSQQTLRCLVWHLFFPNAYRRVLVLLWGSGGWGVFARRCFCVHNRRQPFATVYNRSQLSAIGRYGGAYGECCKSGRFWRFQTSRNLVSCGRRGTLWHSSMFHNVSKSLCVTGAILSRRFQKMTSIFRGRRRRKHFGDLHRHFAWQAQHFRRVVPCFLRITLPGLRQVVTTCKFRGRPGILWHLMKSKGSLARNIESVKIWGSLARNARFEAPTCLVSILWFSCGVDVPMGGAAKPLMVEGFKSGSYVVLRGRHGTSWHSHMSQRQPQHFGHVHLHVAWQAHFRRVVLRVCGESDC